jgi:hypothetical protein
MHFWQLRLMTVKGILLQCQQWHQPLAISSPQRLLLSEATTAVTATTARTAKMAGVPRIRKLSYSHTINHTLQLRKQ